MTTIQKSFVQQSLDDLLAEWNDMQGSRTMSDAEDLINALQVELAGKESVIDELQKDIRHYRSVV